MLTRELCIGRGITSNSKRSKGMPCRFKTFDCVTLEQLFRLLRSDAIEGDVMADLKVLTWEDFNIDDWEDNIPVVGLTPLELESESESDSDDEDDCYDPWEDWEYDDLDEFEDVDDDDLDEFEDVDDVYLFVQELLRDISSAKNWYTAKVDLPVLDWEEFAADESCIGLTPFEGDVRNLLEDYLPKDD